MADHSIDELYLKKSALDQIGGDASAIGAASFDRVEIINDPVRGPLKFGYDADLGQNYEISTAEDQPITDAPQEPNIKTIVEDGVSFDVEVQPDGSEFLLGKTGAPEERRGVKIQLRGPSEPEQPGLPAPVAGEDATEDDGIGEVLTDVGRGIVSGVVKGAEEITKTFRLDGLVDYLREQLRIEPTKVDPPKGLAGQLAEPLAQGLAVMAPAALGLGALGVTSAFLRWTLAGAAGDALAFSPDAPGIGELAADLGKLDSDALEAVRVGIKQAFEKNEGDGEFKKRMKNLGGGVLLGGTIDGLVAMFRAAKGFKNASKATKEKLRKLIGEADTALTGAGAGAAVAIPVAVEVRDGKEGETIQLAGMIDRFLSRAVRAVREVPEAAPTKPTREAPPFVDLPGIDIPIAPKVPPIGRVSTTEEAMAAFDIIAKEKAAEIKKATRGKVSLKETEEAGRRIERETLDLMGEEGDSVTGFMEGLASSVKNLDARIQAARELLVSSMEMATERATAIVKPLEEITDKELFDYLEQEARHNQLQILFTGARAEIGRALGSFRNVAESAGDVSLAAKERTSQVISETIQQSGGKKAIVARAVALLSTPPEKRGGLIKKLQRSTALDVIQEIYINNLLFGLRTQEVNFASTQLFMLWQPLERIAAAAVGITRRALGSTKETVQMQEAAALLVGYVEGIKDSAKVGWQVFKTETPNDPLTKIETSRFRAITSERLGLDPGSALGKAVDIYGIYQRVPGRGLMAVDEFNKGIARNMERRAQAVRLSNAALDEGVEPEEAARLYANVLAGNNQTAEEAARTFADTVTFTRELGEAGQSFQNFVRKVPGVFVVLPFIRTPTNLIKEFAYRGPQAALAPKVYRAWKAGGVERDMAMAKIGLGTGLMMWASSLAMGGIINGYGPTNFKQRKVWLEKNQPYSVNLRKLLGDERFEKMGLEREWLPFGGLEPLDTLFGVSANFAQWKMWGPLEQINEEDEALVSVAALGAVLQNLGDRTYLRGISEAAEAFDEPERFLERYLANVITRAIPFVGTTMSGDIESAISPPRSDVRRDPNEKNPAINHFYAIMNKIMARTPGLSGNLPPNVTDDGRDIVAFEGSWVNAFNRFAPKAVKATPYHEELIRLHYPLSMPRRAAFGVKLRPWQYYRMMKAFNEVEFEYVPGDGKPVNKLAALNRLVQSAQYNAQFTIEGKLALIKRIRSKYLDAAKNAMTDTTNEKYYDSDLFAAKIERLANPGTVDFLEPPP